MRLYASDNVLRVRFVHRHYAYNVGPLRRLFFLDYKWQVGIGSNTKRGVRMGGKIKGQHMACDDSGRTRGQKETETGRRQGGRYFIDGCIELIHFIDSHGVSSVLY